MIVICLAASLTASCAPTTDRPAAIRPAQAFDPLAFFVGHTHSWGVMENRSGAPIQSVVTDSQGEQIGPDRLRMVQHLYFQDGKAQERVWTLWRTGDNRFQGTANDMIGTATGDAEGGMFHWQWTLASSPGNPLMNMTVNQWMYRMQDGTVTIRTTISKLGFIAAEVTEQFVRT